MWAAHNKADTAAKYTTYVGHGTFTLDKDDILLENKKKLENEREN